MACNNHGARPRLLAWSNEVCGTYAFAGVGCLELLGKLVVAYTADVNNGIWWEDILHAHK